jgi:hypothetical protein
VRSRGWVALVAVTGALGCGSGHAGSGTAASGHAGGGTVASVDAGTAAVTAPGAVVVTPPVAAVVPAPGVAAVTAPVTAGRSFAGTFEGRAVDPPLRALLPTMVVDPWTAHGEATLSVPGSDGPVAGALHGGSGSFAMRVRGFRYGDHVRATLEPEGPATEDAFRGTLDAEVHGDTLRGTWTCSAGAGQRVRAGTLEAHPR